MQDISIQDKVCKIIAYRMKYARYKYTGYIMQDISIEDTVCEMCLYLNLLEILDNKYQYFKDLKTLF